jgi:MFS family permease
MFESFEYRNFRWLFSGTAVAFLALNMQIICRSWLVLRLSGDSPFALAMVTMAFAGPLTVLSLVGGALADRIPRKRVIIASFCGNAILTFLMATLDVTGLIRFWHLIVIGMINGSIMAFNMPSRHAMVADIVPTEGLMNAVALMNSAMNITRVIGPASAGVLILYMNTSGVFYLNCGIYLFSVVCIMMIRLEKNVSSRSGKGMAEDIREGLSYAKGDSTLRGLIIMLFVPSLFGFAYHTLLPAWAREALDVRSDNLGYLMMMMGVGALTGSLFLASLKNLKRRGALLLAISLIWGISIALFSKTSSYTAALPLIFVIGAVSAVFMSLDMTLLQIYSSAEMRGRIMSLGLMTLGLMPLSAVPFGIIAEWIGTDNSLLISGVILVILTIAFARWNTNFQKIA